MKTEQQLRQLLDNVIYCFNNFTKNPAKYPASYMQYIRLLEWILEITPDENIDDLLAYKIKKIKVKVNKK